VSWEGELVDLAEEAKIIDKSGAWYSYGGQRLGQGRDNVRTLFRDNPDLAREIEAKLLEHFAIQRLNAAPTPTAE